VADVGCGSGILAVTLRLELAAESIGTDISIQALKVAAQNAACLGAPVRFVACDLVSALGDRSCDLLVSNPPYVPDGEAAGLQREVRDYEPHVALFAGPTGFEIYDRLVAEAPRVLKPGGWLVLELGYQSLAHVRSLVAVGWTDIRVQSDLAGIPRVLAARRAL
jgi:release factor glutamine methyltransferase